MGAIQQCIDESTDTLMQQQAAKGKTDCSVMDVKRSNGRVSIHSVCKAEGITITSNAILRALLNLPTKEPSNPTMILRSMA